MPDRISYGLWNFLPFILKIKSMHHLIMNGDKKLTYYQRGK